MNLYKELLNSYLKPYSFIYNNKAGISLDISNRIINKNYFRKIDYNDIILKPVKKHLNEINNFDNPIVYTASISSAWCDSLGNFEFIFNGVEVKDVSKSDIIFTQFDGYIYILVRRDLGELPNIDIILKNGNNNFRLATDEEVALHKSLYDEIEYTQENNLNILKIPLLASGEIPLSTNHPSVLKYIYEYKLNGRKIYPDVKKIKPLLATPDKLERFSRNVLEDTYQKMLFSRKNLDVLVVKKSIKSHVVGKLINNLERDLKSNTSQNLKTYLTLFGLIYDNYNFENPSFNNYYEIFYIYEDLEDNGEEWYYRDILNHIEATKKNRSYIMAYSLLSSSRKINDDTYRSCDLYSRIPNYDTIDETNLMKVLLNINFDLFMYCYKYKHQNKFTLTRDNVIFNTERYGDKMVKFSFRNYYEKPFEIYFFGVLYTGTYIKDDHGEFVDIYINKSLLKEYYNVNFDEDDFYGMVVLRHENYTRREYNNIHRDYNGVIPLSEEFFLLHDKRVYDNGHFLHENDYVVNSLFPNGLLCLFPKRHFEEHKLLVTGYVRPTKSFRVTYQLRNGSKTYSTEYGSQYVYFSKNYMKVPYIDYRYNIYLNNRILTPDVDYEILGFHIIYFKKNQSVEQDRKISVSDITIELEDYNPDEILELTKRRNITSNTYLHGISRIDFSRYPEFTINKTIKFDNPKLDLPVSYKNEVFRNHMMMTKYYCGEDILIGDDEYGSTFMDNLKMEFPEFVLTSGENKLINTQITISDNDVFPRIISIPARFNLNDIVENHIIAVERLDFETGLFNEEYSLSKNRYYRYKRKHHHGDIEISPNIPINYVLDKTYSLQLDEEFRNQNNQ